jgi:ABC-type transporter Mla MlaB component
MDLILEVRTGRRQVTLACRGKLVGGEEGDAFRRSALLMMGGFDKMTINLAGVRSADGGGFSSLASVLAHASARGKQVRIKHASPWMLGMLESCGLNGFLEPFQSALPPSVSGAQEACA